MRVCFWNTNKNKQINRYLVDIIKDNNIDILVLAEYTADIIDLINKLGHYKIVFEELITAGCERIHILAKNIIAEPGFQNKYCSLQLINDEYIFACVHLPGKVFANEEKQDVVIGRIMEEIHKFEKKLNKDSTIIVGDFNRNPYENGCLGARGFHGIPSHEDAMKIFRVILDEKFAMFYNPMWNLLGDFSFPPGTFYYGGNEVANPFWNMYDQVIINPKLKKFFLEEELKIIYETKNDTLIDKKRHPNSDISDHLPIVFEIKEVNHGI